jgi:DNA-directed RNA polymerase specialized sigma24 family protein
MNDSVFQVLVDRARTGDETAAATLVTEYQTELHRYVRFKLTSPAVRRVVDSLDVCQSVLAGFFVSLRDGRLEVIQPRQLFRLLAVMAENKVRDKVRVHHAARRGGGALADGGPVDVVEGRDEDPAEAVEGRELLASVRDRLRVDDREVVDRWLAGEGWPQIAAAVGKKPDAVRHQVTRAVDQAARELGLIGETP